MAIKGNLKTFSDTRLAFMSKDLDAIRAVDPFFLKVYEKY